MISGNTIVKTKNILYIELFRFSSVKNKIPVKAIIPDKMTVMKNKILDPNVNLPFL